MNRRGWTAGALVMCLAATGCGQKSTTAMEKSDVDCANGYEVSAQVSGQQELGENVRFVLASAFSGDDKNPPSASFNAVVPQGGRFDKGITASVKLGETVQHPMGEFMLVEVIRAEGELAKFSKQSWALFCFEPAGDFQANPELPKWGTGQFSAKYA